MKLAGYRLAQRDGYSCGPTVAVVAAALLDRGYRQSLQAGPQWFAAEQTRVHRAANRIWPRRLGMTPCAVAAAVNTHSPVRYRWRCSRGLLPGGVDRLTDVLAAVEAGRPVAMLIGRVIPLVSLEGRAWDTGIENLWVHVDSEGAIDWVGVVDPTLRALSDDPHLAPRSTVGAVRTTRDGIVGLPGEAALCTWVAHRSHRALAPLFAKLYEVSGGAISIAAMWNIVGAAVVGASTQVPLLAGSSELTSMCRGQAILDALVGFGLPVRGASRPAAGKALLN